MVSPYTLCTMLCRLTAKIKTNIFLLKLGSRVVLCSPIGVILLLISDYKSTTVSVDYIPVNSAVEVKKRRNHLTIFYLVPQDQLFNGVACALQPGKINEWTNERMKNMRKWTIRRRERKEERISPLCAHIVVPNWTMSCIEI